MRRPQRLIAAAVLDSSAGFAADASHGRQLARRWCISCHLVVSNQRPQPSSARNTWPAKITGLTLLADRVRLDLDGQPPALVDVAPAAVAELSLEAGSEVWLTVKATDLAVYTHAEKTARLS